MKFVPFLLQACQCVMHLCDERFFTANPDLLFAVLLQALPIANPQLVKPLLQVAERLLKSDNSENLLCDVLDHPQLKQYLPTFVLNLSRHLHDADTNNEAVLFSILVQWTGMDDDNLIHILGQRVIIELFTTARSICHEFTTETETVTSSSNTSSSNSRSQTSKRHEIMFLCFRIVANLFATHFETLNLLDLWPDFLNFIKTTHVKLQTFTVYEQECLSDCWINWATACVKQNPSALLSAWQEEMIQNDVWPQLPLQLRAQFLLILQLPMHSHAQEETQAFASVKYWYAVEMRKIVKETQSAVEQTFTFTKENWFRDMLANNPCA